MSKSGIELRVSRLLDRTAKTAPRRALAVLSLIGIVVCLACGGSGNGQSAGKGEKGGKKGKKEKAEMTGNAIAGGTYEASGVIQVPNTDKVLFVDDGRPGEVLMMQIGQEGQQVGTVTSISTGVLVENPEGITCDGTRFYIVGSQSNPKRGEQNAIARFTFSPDTNRIENVEVIKDLRAVLLNGVADLKGDADKPGTNGGLNIEGLAWDQQNQRLLLGLRSPIRSGQALLLPLKLRDPNGAFAVDNLDFNASRLLQVPLDGQGVRDIQYDASLKAFLLISGAPENVAKGEFVLWQWDGSAGGSQPTRKMTLDANIKPEAVTEFRHGEQKFMFLMGDASRYFKSDY